MRCVSDSSLRVFVNRVPVSESRRPLRGRLLPGTSLVISTFPISRGRTKCTTPCRVFLSERNRFKMFAVWNLTLGSLPKPITEFVMRPAVTLSSLPVESAMCVAAIMPQATASP